MQFLCGSLRLASPADSEFLKYMADVAFYRHGLYIEYLAYFGVAFIGA